jgi:hypothetical protein
VGWGEGEKRGREVESLFHVAPYTKPEISHYWTENIEKVRTKGHIV